MTPIPPYDSLVKNLRATCTWDVVLGVIGRDCPIPPYDSLVQNSKPSSTWDLGVGVIGRDDPIPPYDSLAQNSKPKTIWDSMPNTASELLYAYDEGQRCHNFLSLLGVGALATMTKSCDKKF